MPTRANSEGKAHLTEVRIPTFDSDNRSWLCERVIRVCLRELNCLHPCDGPLPFLDSVSYLKAA